MRGGCPPRKGAALGSALRALRRVLLPLVFFLLGPCRLERNMFKTRVRSTVGVLLFTCVSVAGRAGIPAPANSPSKPRVLVVAVNGAEWDLLRPLLIRGEMPNLKRVVEKGVYGKLRTISAPNCPKIFTAFLTGVAP